MDFHDPADNRQTQPRSLARWFGREKRFKQLARIFRHDAVARVVNFNGHACRSVAVSAREVGGESPHGERAAGRHRLNRIKKEIHEHVLDACSIQQQGRQGGVEFAHHRYALLVQLMPHKRECVFDDFMDVLARTL